MADLRKVVFCGHSGAGKDTAADWMAANCVGVTRGATSSDYLVDRAAAAWSLAADDLRARRHEYAVRLRDFANRLRDNDPGLFLRKAFETGTIIAGPRDPREVAWGRAHGVDLFVWVASDRVPRDPTMEFGPELCDIVIANHTTRPAFYAVLARWARFSGYSLYSPSALVC